MSVIDDLPEEDKRWFLHVGYLAQNWALVETFMDAIIREIHARYEGDRIQPEIPQAFNRKRIYIRKAFAAHPKLASYSVAMEDILEKAAQLASVRHWALHSGWDANETTARLSRFSRAEPSKIEQREFTADEFLAAANDSGSLALTLFFVSEVAFGRKTYEEQKTFLLELIDKAGSAAPPAPPSSPSAP